MEGGCIASGRPEAMQPGVNLVSYRLATFHQYMPEHIARRYGILEPDRLFGHLGRW
jgi:hypothetical protein